MAKAKYTTGVWSADGWNGSGDGIVKEEHFAKTFWIVLLNWVHCSFCGLTKSRDLRETDTEICLPSAPRPSLTVNGECLSDGQNIQTQMSISMLLFLFDVKSAVMDLFEVFIFLFLKQKKNDWQKRRIMYSFQRSDYVECQH